MVTDRDDDPFGWWRTVKDQSKDKSNQLFDSQVVRDLEKYGTVHKFENDSEFSRQKSQGGSRGRVQGVRTPSPPPEMTCGFLIKLVKKNYVVY